MQQKANTILLLIAIALLVGLWLRPQPGRYRSLGSDYLPYVLDSATGQLVVVRATPEARAYHQRGKHRKKRRPRPLDRSGETPTATLFCKVAIPTPTLYGPSHPSARRNVCATPRSGSKPGRPPRKSKSQGIYPKIDLTSG